MSKILDTLYLGSYGDARNQAFLKKAGVTHIVTVGVELQTLYPQSFKYLYIPAYDHPSYQLAPFFDQIADFIHNAIEREKGTVFVHCQMGISRSTTSVISYLMKYHRMHPMKAGIFVKSKRAIVYPNPGFLYQLEGYAKKLGLNNNNEEKPGLKSMSSSASNGFGLTNGLTSPKKEAPVLTPQKSETKTLAMTSSAWKPNSRESERSERVERSDKRAMSMTTSNWSANVKTKEERKLSDNDYKVTNSEKEYSCKTCGTKLFNSANIEHDANTSSFCTTVYVKFMPWIGVSKNSTSKIYCPNGKCNTVLGFSNQNGGKCPCGKRIERMHGLYPLKLTDQGQKNRMTESLRAW